MADMNLHERLQREGFSTEQSLGVRKKVTTAEKGKRYVLQVCCLSDRRSDYYERQ